MKDNKECKRGCPYCTPNFSKRRSVMKDIKISNDIIYVGVDDKEIRLFEGQYDVPNGISYNS
jgi:hypothetical protein